MSAHDRTLCVGGLGLHCRRGRAADFGAAEADCAARRARTMPKYQDIAPRRLRCGDCGHPSHPLPSCRSLHPRRGPPLKRSISRRKGRLIRPGGDQKRRNPAAFYWHPYRASASVRSHGARKAGPDLHRSPPGSGFALARGLNPAFEPHNAPRFLDRPTPCASLSTSPIFRRTPEQFCACAPVSASRPILSSRPDFPTTDRAFRRAGWTTSMPSHRAP